MLEITGSLPADHADTAVAIGKFRSIHLGHQQLIHELIQAAEDSGLSALVLTFDRHPNAILKPDAVPAAVIGPRQQRRLLEVLGVDVLKVASFDEKFANSSPEEFVTKHLVPLRARLVLVGGGFKFGAGGEGNIETLRQLGLKYGFQVREVSNIEVNGKKISTTAIRELLDLGKVEMASMLLGRNHATEGWSSMAEKSVGR